MSNFMYQKLFKVKVWNYLVTHWKKLATQKCVETPWLKTTRLDMAILYAMQLGLN